MLTQEEILYKLIQGEKGNAWVTLNAQWDIDAVFAGTYVWSTIASEVTEDDLSIFV